MCEEDNALHLCDSFSGKGCHEKYDKTWDSAKSMPVWSLAVKRFQNFKDKIRERSFVLLHFEN